MYYVPISCFIIISISDRLDIDDLLLNFQRFGEGLCCIDLLLNNFENSHFKFEDETIGMISNECPKLKSLSLGSHSLVHSNLIIYVESLKYLSMRCKELKHLKITKAKVRAGMNQFGKPTEGEIEEMFPNWNMEIRECEFLSFDVWFEQRRLRLNSEASRMVHYMMKN